MVDLPDAVGHPAFPTTLEGLVSSSRGTVMDAARAALQRDDAWNWRVPKPRVLTPLFPQSLLSPRAMDVDRRIVGPEQAVPWPEEAAWLDYEPMVAAVVGNEGAKLEADAVGDHVFGYTLVSDWRAHASDGAPVEHADGVPIAIGPCVVTTDELDPQTMFVTVKVDDQDLLKGNLNGAAAEPVPPDRRRQPARGPGTRRRLRARSVPAGRGRCRSSRRLWPGAQVELAAEGIGTLRNRVDAR